MLSGWPRIPRGALIFLLFASCQSATASQSQTGANPLAPQTQEQLRDLAGQVLREADKVGCKSGDCRLLVLNFTLNSGDTTLFAMQLADDLSQDLARCRRDIAIVDRAELREFLSAERIPSKLLSADKAARWLGRRLDATTVLTGEIEALPDSARLTTQLLGTKKDKKSPKQEVHLSGINLNQGFSPAEPFGSNAASNSSAGGIPRAGTHGVTVPVCIYCPDPSYTPDARDAKFQGTLVLTIIVSKAGQVQEAKVVSGVPFGMTEKAVQTVRQWRLKPATSERIPVDTVVQVEVTFHPF